MPHWTRLWLSHPTTLCCGQTAPLLAPMHHRAPPCTTRTSPGSVVDKGHSGMSATARLTSRRTETLHSHRTCCEQSTCDVFSAGLLKWRSTVSTESTAHPKERCYCYLARTLPTVSKECWFAWRWVCWQRTCTSWHVWNSRNQVVVCMQHARIVLLCHEA